MSKNPSETLRILFAIEQTHIERDLKRADKNPVGFANEISSIFAIPLDAGTAEIDARLSHLLLVQARELSHRKSERFMLLSAPAC